MKSLTGGYKPTPNFHKRMAGEIRSLPTFSRAQLALRNGQDREEIWLAYRGIIYDVTTSRLWRQGKHYEHWAGQDLTEELADAPHTEQVFKKFNRIGKLI